MTAWTKVNTGKLWKRIYSTPRNKNPCNNKKLKINFGDTLSNDVNV